MYSLHMLGDKMNRKFLKSEHDVWQHVSYHFT